MGGRSEVKGDERQKGAANFLQKVDFNQANNPHRRFKDMFYH